MKLYRDMEKDDDGKPKLGLNSKRLGVRITGLNKEIDEPSDTELDENGDVSPGEGMSVTPPDIKKNVWGQAEKRIAKGITVMWEIDETALQRLSLRYCKDEDNDRHGVIEPAHTMQGSRYASLIQATRNFWRQSDDL